LLLGKSGTGKDIFAQAIHNNSDRRKGPYVAINCAAIPRDLVTSELFGYSEGAFTGSRRGGSQGKFELADGGTIFLDEIAETPLELQAVLLRVIEDKTITRIGGTRIQPVDVRIIAATNKDLQEEVLKRSFREDLYYRLNIFAIQMVPLNERQDDIAMLANTFIKKYAKALGKIINRVDDSIIEAFMQYPWPGNVRELQNVIERMINFCQTDELIAELIPQNITGYRQQTLEQEEFRSPKYYEREMITRMLQANLTKSEIAQKMEMTRTTLYRKLKQYNLA
jgi:transcriptional regulator with PAS, ATPase and Fis domain